MDNIPITILLVEDDESLQEGIRDLLEVNEDGFNITVLTASDGLKALETMQAITPHLIISDIMMPRMDGLQFLETVRNNHAWVHIPFIFLTAKGKKEEIREGRLSGAELYITKPFESQELVELVKAQLERSYQLQEARQKHLQNFKRSVMQVLNHEFRTPLTYVTAYYEMLSDSLAVYEDTENVDAFLQGILSGCNRLTDLVEDLIMVLEIRSGEAQAVMQQQGQLIENVGQLFEQAGYEAQKQNFKAESVEFIYDISPSLPALWGVPRYLNLIFYHLIENAIKFASANPKKKGKVKLQATAVGSVVQFQVIDNGLGVPAYMHEKIFDLFVQHNRDRFEQQGSGSGLTIAKGLVQLHGGEIGVESIEDKGATFTVRVPIYQKTAGDTPLSQPTFAPPATILLVEDDYYLLEGLKELLEIYEGPYQLKLLTATNGLEGLEMVKKYTPDLIISDIMMPQMDGFSFLAAVRQQPQWLHIPFIFLTAKGERHDILKGRQSGVEEYITKPYDSDELMDLMTSQLKRYFQRQQATNQDFESLKQSILGLLQQDFRTPLHSVTTHSLNMVSNLQEAQNPADLKGSLLVIQQGSEKISRLVGDFIFLLELRTGEKQNAFRDLAMVFPEPIYLIQSVLGRVQPLLEAYHLTLETVIDSHLPPALMDYDALADGLARWLEAAVYACVEGGASSLRLEAKPLNDRLYLAASHTGRPLPAEIGEKIQQFLAGQNDGLMIYFNYGPNLAIAKGLLDLHGGQMNYQSQTDGREIFSIVLPPCQVTV